MNAKKELSKPANKVKNVLVDFLDKEATQKAILKLREVHNLPTKGLDFEEGKHDKFPYEAYYIMWSGAREAGVENNESDEIRKEVHKLIGLLEIKLPISLVEFYFYYNELPKDQNYLTEELEDSKLCSFLDAGEEFRQYNSDDNSELMESYRITAGGRFRNHPLAIFFSPFATRNDLIETFDQAKEEILKTQEIYREKLTSNKDMPSFTASRKRSTKVKDIRDFIYANRDTGSKDLMKMVSNNFSKVYSPSEITKIISEEREKRS